MGMKKIILSAIVILVSTSSAQAAKTLKCKSGSNAPAYENARGRWYLNAKVQSAYTLREIELTNARKRDLGAKAATARYDRKITDARLFKLKPDVFCNYDVIMPKQFSDQESFKAELTMTCDDMFDGTADLSCSIL